MNIINTIKNHYNSLSLIKKMTFVYTFVILIPAVFFATYSYHQSRNHAQQEIISESEQIIFRIKESINNSLLDVEDIANKIASNYNTITFLSKDFELSFEDLQSYRKHIIKNIDDFLRFNQAYIDNITLFIDNPTFAESWPFLYRAYHLKEFKWYQEFLQSDDRDILIKDSIQFNPRTTRNTRFVPYYTYCRKLYSIKGDFLGILMVNIDKRRFLASIKNNLAILKESHDFHLMENEQFKEEFQRVFKDQNIQVSDKGNFLYGDYIYIYDRYQDLDLSIFTKVSISSLNKTLNISRNNILRIIALTIVFLAVITYYISMIILKSMNNIISTANNVIETENFSIRIPVKRNDELGMIAKDFNLLLEKIRNLIASLLIRETAHRDAQLMALQYQINPHFIYNTLEIFRTKFELSNDYNSADAVTNFGEMIRYNLNDVNKYVSLEDEIKHVENYINLQRLRFEGILLKIYLPKGLKKYKINKFILQPIVENSIKHGYTFEKKLFISIHCLLIDDQRLEIRIKDNGKGVSPGRLNYLNQRFKYQDPYQEEKDLSDCIGLFNINKRLKLFYGENFYLQMESEINKFTKVVFQIPLDKGDELDVHNFDS